MICTQKTFMNRNLPMKINKSNNNHGLEHVNSRIVHYQDCGFKSRSLASFASNKRVGSNGLADSFDGFRCEIEKGAPLGSSYSKVAKLEELIHEIITLQNHELVQVLNGDSIFFIFVAVG